MKPNKSGSDSLPFGRKNFLWMGLGGVTLIVGYALLWQPHFTDAKEFSLALYVAPWVILAGVSLLIYSTLVSPK
ncbi:MAG: DUF3098 domain-containing protein [Bacteroidia bacterium]